MISRVTHRLTEAGVDDGMRRMRASFVREPGFVSVEAFVSRA